MNNFDNFNIILKKTFCSFFDSLRTMFQNTLKYSRIFHVVPSYVWSRCNVLRIEYDVII